jgi:hypothetical protein
LRIHWLAEPEESSYPAAEDYMSLLLPPVRARRLVERFRTAKTAYWLADDLLRASRSTLPPKRDEHVAESLDEIANQRPLSPVLLVRGDMGRGVPLQIVDGLHRLCAAYRVDTDAIVACRMIDLDW